MTKTARVFVRKTSMTPDDRDAVIGRGPLLFDKYDEAHISVAFTWDIEQAKQLADQWSRHCETKIGGPAMGQRGEHFEPGRFLKQGMVITSRGCPNRCWFCSVWRREGSEVRELPVTEGWNVLDDNLLRCSKQHIETVFAMLKRQKKNGNRIVFSGGLESAALEDWHIDGLRELRPQRIYFAYDTPDDYEPLVEAGKRLLNAGFTKASKVLCCYCLVGYPGDGFDNAEFRLRQCIKAGFVPMAMLWRDNSGKRSLDWMRFQRTWARPEIVNTAFRREL